MGGESHCWSITVTRVEMSTGHFGRAVPVGLRRFPLLHGRTLEGSKIVFPTDLAPLNAPFNVATFNFKNKHVWNARTWAGLHSSLELMRPAGEALGMYHVWLFPTVHRLWSPIWRRWCRSWAEENGIPASNVIAVYGDRDAICEDIGIFNDGRQYGFLIRNSGKVLFASDGRYLSNKHDIGIHKAIRTFYSQQSEDEVEDSPKAEE